MKYFGILVILLLNSFVMSSQELIQKDKITLNTGEVFIGEILVRNNELIMLKTIDGGRYQFQLSEIKIVEKELIPVKSNINTKESIPSTVNFSGVFEFLGGVSTAKNCFNTSPNAQLSLIFGNKNLFNKNLFLGLGVGINNTIVSPNSSSMAFLPVFIRLQSTVNKARTSPFFGMDAGYAFALTQSYDGGFLVKVTAGISHKISYKSYLTLGIYAGVNSISGNLIESNDLGIFRYYGNTNMNTFGVKIGLQF